ncbi:hypothetical protein, partial [Parasutterella sp.]
ISMNKVTDDGEIIDYGWYKEIHTDGPIKYDTPEYAFEEADEEKTKDFLCSRVSIIQGYLLI